MHEIDRWMTSDLLGHPVQGGALSIAIQGGALSTASRAPDRPDAGSDMSFSRAGQGLLISTVTVASP